MAIEQDVAAWLEEHSDNLGFDYAQGRKAFLRSAGLTDLCARLHLEGAADVFCANLVGMLAEYGMFDDGSDPLVSLLCEAKTRLGSDKQAQCDDLIAQWQAAPPRPKRAHRSDAPRQLPARAEHFTNRVAELNRLLQELQPRRVVTLCGPGGIGKSALAAEAVWRLAPDRFPDGILFHTFYGQPDPNVAFEHLARSYGVEPQPTPANAALRALAGKRALLMLDGTEDAKNLAAVLDVRGECGVIITSRERKDAVAERQDVTPLPQGEAVALLTAWSGSRAPEAAAARICAIVGGLPLAVRLVGRYLNETGDTAEEYLRWLDTQPLDALDRGTHRHDSVNVLLARSVAHLSPAARQALALFGAFAFAPVNRAALAAALPETDLRRALNELVGYGLLMRDGERYAASHALIHTYSRECCPAPPDAVGRLSAYYTAFAREQTAQGVPGYARLDTERSHIMRMLETCKEREQWQALSDLVKAAWKYLDLRGYWTDFQTALELNLIAAQQQGDRKDEGWCAGSLGYLAKKRGDYATALTYSEQSLAIHRKVGNKAMEGTTLNNLATTAYAKGDYAVALTYLEQSLAIRREIGDKTGEGTTLNNLSQIYDARGDYATALTYLEQSLAIQREIGDKAGEGTTLNNLSKIYHARGDYATALTYSEQSLAIERDIGDKAGEGTTLNNLSQIYDARGDYAAALAYLEQSLAIHRKVGNKAMEGTTLNNLATTAYARGDYATALTYVEQSLAIQREIGDIAGMCATLFNMGRIHAQNNDVSQALSAWVTVYRLARPRKIAQALDALEKLAKQLGIPDGLDGWENLSKNDNESENAANST